MDASPQLLVFAWWKAGLESVQSIDLFWRDIAQNYGPQPTWPRIENQPRCPHVFIAWRLRPGESIDVSAVLGDQHEIVKVPLNKLCLVLRPEGTLNRAK